MDSNLYKCSHHQWLQNTREWPFHCILWNCQNGVKYESKKKILHPRVAPKIQSENKIDFWCFNATFSNISAISWRPVLVVEEAGENHRPWASNW